MAELSKDQVDILNAVKKDSKLFIPDLYAGKNKVLLALNHDGYFDHDVAVVGGETVSTGIHLSAKALHDLALYEENQAQSFKNGFTYPIITSTIAAIVGAVFGSLVTYLLMR